MQHTNFTAKYKELEAQERRELAAAIKAHGGEYVFFDCSADDAESKWLETDADSLPTVYGAFQWFDESTRFYVTRISIGDDGIPRVYGFHEDFRWPNEEDLIYTIDAGYIGELLDWIPETENMHDVRELPCVTSVPVLTVSRNDVETIGFNPDLTDDELMGLGYAVGKRMEAFMDDYWIALEDACETIGYERIKKDDDE